MSHNPHFKTLDPRLDQAMALMASGVRHSEIAKRMQLSSSSIEKLLAKHKEANDCNNTTHLVAMYYGIHPEQQPEAYCHKYHNA